MSKFTPGPWQNGPYDARFIFSNDGGKLVAEACHDAGSDCLANARLITAAPLLYEALRALIVDHGPAGNPMVDASLDKLKAAQAALAAAGGE